jgi:hypothetical protein
MSVGSTQLRTVGLACACRGSRTRVLRCRKPVHGFGVTATFAMLDMDMPTQSHTLPEHGSGVYEQTKPALVMVRHRGLTFEFQPAHGAPFTVVIEDRANG